MNAASGQGGHQMFDSRNANAVVVRDTGVQVGVGDPVPACGDQRVAVGHIAAAKPDAIFGRRRLYGNTHGFAGVQTGAGECRRGFDRRLQGFAPFLRRTCLVGFRQKPS